MDDTVITVDGLRRRYGGSDGFEAVRGVDLEVHRGELFALLGTNGAGKTSMLEVVEGMAPPTAGSVRVLGLDPVRDRGRLRPRTGIMLQEAGFPSDLRAGEVVRMWRGTLSTPHPVTDALDMVGLADRADVAVQNLSGGERRRLDLALAIMGRPEVLFLDEPTTGLDPESRHAAWQLVEDLLGQGTTVVLTTHYLEEAERLADRLAILHRGRVVRSGTVPEVVASEPARITFAPVSHGGTAAEVVGRLPALPALVDAPVQSAGTVTITTTDLQPTLTALLGWAAEQQVGLADLDARSASLEQAFLTIATDTDDDAPQRPGRGRAEQRPTKEAA